MSHNEMRMEAAQTLVVPYDATPQMVNDAYERRVVQRMGLTGMDAELRVRGLEQFYDARIRMRMSEKYQWLANARLALTPRKAKVNHAIMTYMAVNVRNMDSVIAKILFGQILSELKKINWKYRILHTAIIYEVTGLWATVLYNMDTPFHTAAVPGAVWASFVVGAAAIWGLDASIKRSQYKIYDLLKTAKILDSWQK